ncbi:MAG: hypothetical protein QME45_10175 [Clostridiales bacterium]|nr:hypothetical protein [Clostridiales bacterium]
MIEEMCAELAGLSAKLERKKKIDSMLQNLQIEENDLAQRERHLKSALSREQTDVDRLERTTATSILYSILGKKEDRLDKEQQEAYAARLKYDAVVRQLDDCRIRIDELCREKDSLSDCDGRYKEVFAKLQELLREDSTYAKRLCALERRLGETVSQLKELDEAISAGSAAMRQIDSIENNLGSANSWGTWDLLGGGLISDLAKHSHLNEAQDGVEHLQVLLNRFHAELADIRIDTKMGNINIEGFLRFADYFFDGLIADWSVLSHIHASQESVHNVKVQVADALSKLSAIKTARTAEKADVEKQIAALVTSV